MAENSNNLFDEKETVEYITNLFNGKTMKEIQSMEPDVEWEKANGEKNYPNQLIADLSRIVFSTEFAKQKREIIIQADETYSLMDFSKFLSKMIEKGFKIGLKKSYELNSKPETEVILFDEENGYIVYATSIINGKLNNATLYGEIEPTGYHYQKGDKKKYPEVKELFDNYYKFIDNHPTTSLTNYINTLIVQTGLPQDYSGSSIYGFKNHYEFRTDITECAITKIDNLRSKHTFSKPTPIWNKKNKFLWFVNAVEDMAEAEDIDNKKISNEKILACPPEVAKIVNDPARFEENQKTDRYIKKAGKTALTPSDALSETFKKLIDDESSDDGFEL